MIGMSIPMRRPVLGCAISGRNNPVDVVLPIAKIVSHPYVRHGVGWSSGHLCSSFRDGGYAGKLLWDLLARPIPFVNPSTFIIAIVILPLQHLPLPLKSSPRLDGRRWLTGSDMSFEYRWASHSSWPLRRGEQFRYSSKELSRSV